MTAPIPTTDPKEFGLPESMWGTLQRGAVDYPFWCRFWLDWDPHPGQVEWGAQRAKQSYLSTGSRWGKSEGVATKELWYGFHHQNAPPSLNCSITLDQSRIVIDKAEMLAMRSKRFRGFVQDVVRSPFPALRLRNGWEYWARSTQLKCKYVRGHAFGRINYDEAAYGSASHLEVLLLRLADYNGDFSATSTPRGMNWFYRESLAARAAMEADRARGLPLGAGGRFFKTGPSFENPHVSHEFLQGLRERLPELAYRQEVGGEFVATQGTVFDMVYVDRVMNADLNPMRVGDEPRPESTGLYVVGWDLGRKSSWTVGTVLRVDRLPWRAVHRERHYMQGWPKVIDRIEAVAREWNADTVVDATGLGDVVLGMVEDRGVQAEGVLFSPTSKNNLITGLQHTVQTPGALELPFWRELYDQMVYYTWEERTDDEEERKQTWDDLMSLALAVYKAKTVQVGPIHVASGGRRDTAALVDSSRTRGGTLDRF